MANKHKYKIEAVKGELFCYKDGVQVEDWCFLKGERMPEMKLFVDGVGVATRKEIEWVGLDDATYNNLRAGVEIPYLGVVESKMTVDEVTGEKTYRAVRENGDIAITVLTKDNVIVPEKCKVIKG